MATSLPPLTPPACCAVFDLDTGQLIGAPVALPGEGWPVGFLPDGRVITSTTAALYDVWRAGPTVGPAGVALGSGDGVRARFVRDGTEVVTIKDSDQQALGWDTATGAPIDRLSDRRRSPHRCQPGWNDRRRPPR